jgi:hypothetical protein
MPTRKTSEISRLQEEISREIAVDAPEIAQMVFGGPRDQPDVVTVRNERLDQMYREAYQRDDRTFLQQEARRDPEQFLKVAERIGVQKPPPMPMPLPGFKPSSVPQMAPVAPLAPVPLPAPVAPVAPVAPIVSPPLPQAPPVILGPNGQPLPPGGTVGV